MKTHRILFVLFMFLFAESILVADVSMPSIFGSHMVLQQKQANRVWGWADQGEAVTVKIGDQTKTAQPNADGRWQVTLDALPAGGPHTMTVAGKNSKTFEDVLVGEVWICSGQSNMQWSVAQANDADLEAMSAKYPNVRFISVPQVGTQEPQRDFKGSWAACTPDTVKQFSAVGYFFGRTLHQNLDVPIGLIDDAWGGSACEAWINRDKLKANPRFNDLIKHWEGVEADLANNPQAKNRRLLTGNQRPSNIYNGVLKPTIGYGIKGAIWYQGESNAGRAYQYRELFPFMIQTWRDEWKQGDFPFYWVQLADFRAEKGEPADSEWAELREAQTMTMELPNTGEAVILNLGEATDIHPKNKQDVAKRLARWALAKDYGYTDLVHRSPLYQSMEKSDGSVTLTFQHVGGGLDTFDVREPIGFTIAGADKAFRSAKAQIVGKGRGRTQIKVWSDQVSDPVAVRYAWADNPVCNVQNQEGLPLTPFRTDDWKGITSGKEHR